VFELLCNTELIPEWDVLYKGARYLSIIKDAAARCEVGYIHMVYGLPGTFATTSCSVHCVDRRMPFVLS